MVAELLPYWAERGVDRRFGGFHNRLDHAGRPLAEDRKRLLVHARQLYAFSAGARLGAGFARSVADDAFAFLERRFRDAARGGWHAAVAPSGEPLDRRKDCYALAFVVFALAHYHAASGERLALARARETVELVWEHLRDDKAGGYHEAADADWRPLEELPRRQNPHMHWLEALLSLQAVAPDAALLEEAARIVALLRTRWLDGPRGALGEHFGADWSPAPGAEGAIVEPGHHYEWTWLLARYAEAAAAGEALPLAEGLFAFAEAHGIDRDGSVFDQVDRDGRALRTTKRLWPQTERVKALAVRGARAALAGALATLFARYARADGGWHEHLDRHGALVERAQNATSVYHVTLALGEAAAALRTA